MTAYLLMKEVRIGEGYQPILDAGTGLPKRFPTIFAAMSWAEHEPDFVAAAYIAQEARDD